MQIIVALIGLIAASFAAIAYTFYKAPEAYEGDEGLVISSRRKHGDELAERALSSP